MELGEEDFLLSETQAICDFLRAESFDEDKNWTDDDYGQKHHNSLLCIHLDVEDEDKLCEVFNALKDNRTVVSVYIDGDEWDDIGMRGSLSLAAAISNHPSVTTLVFSGMGSISEVGAIILAYQQCSNLSSLQLNSSTLTPAQMKALDWLLAENALEELKISQCYPEDNVLHLSHGLVSNSSLKELSIEPPASDAELGDFTLSDETILAIPTFLKHNQNVEELELAGFEIPSNVLERIANTLTKHESLKRLSLSNLHESSGADLGRYLSTILASTTTLKTLCIGGCNLGNAGAVELCNGLKQNASLEFLFLMCENLGEDGIASIADSLRNHNALKKLHLPPVGSNAFQHVAQMLTTNKTIELLNTSLSDASGLDAFSSRLAEMHSLRTLILCSTRGLSEQSKTSFLKALERNTELESVKVINHHGDPSAEEILSKARYETALNRAGKRILKSNSHVPSSLWPLILERSSNDPNALYFFLREKPDVLINKPPAAAARVSRKRKRS